MDLFHWSEDTETPGLSNLLKISSIKARIQTQPVFLQNQLS